MATLAEHVAAAATRLEQAGLPRDEARQSAEVLARSVLGWTTAEWLSRTREDDPADFPARFLPLIDRRSRHEPVAYIVGEREFYGRSFVVTRDVLIPRPETELLIEEALGYLRARGAGELPRVVDVGTGSGCIAITLALEFPTARIIATDASEPALSVARANARRLDAANRIDFRLGAFLAGATTPVDLIVSNPPYVADADRDQLAADVVEFEPATALFAGPDGLAAIRPLVEIAARSLTVGGRIILEIGQGQAEAVRQVVEQTGLSIERIRPDLQGIPRVVVACHGDGGRSVENSK